MAGIDQTTVQHVATIRNLLLRCCLRYQTTVYRIAFSDRVTAALQGLFTLLVQSKSCH